MSEEEGNWIKPKNCHAPRLTGLPKIHKEGTPMRGVVSTVGSPFEKISRKLIPILRTIQGRSKLFVKNSTELKENIKDWRIERNEILVSYDVKNLYPSIPVKNALELIESLLASQPNLRNVTKMSVKSIMELLNWMFRLTYCEFEGKYYVLDSGPVPDKYAGAACRQLRSLQAVTQKIVPPYCNIVIYKVKKQAKTLI